MAQENNPKLNMGETVLFWTMVIASFLLVFTVAVLPTCRKSMALEQRVAQMRQSNERLASRLQELESECVALETDPFYVERLARRTMNLRRPGETVVLSLVKGSAEHEYVNAKLNAPAPSVLCDVVNRLAPLATNRALRFMAIVLALANLLAAFILFGRDTVRVVDDSKCS
jgi:cell division protein FtsB